VLILTTDEAVATPGMVSYGELVQGFRGSAWPFTGRAERPKTSVAGSDHLCFVEPGMAYYVKARSGFPESRCGISDLVRFEATVERVLADAARAVPSGAAVVMGSVLNGRLRQRSSVTGAAS